MTLFLALGSGNAQATGEKGAAGEAVRVCGDELEFPPYSYFQRDSNGEKTDGFAGASYELIREIFAAHHIPMKFNLVPWKRCLNSVARGHSSDDFEIFIDGSSNAERLKIYHRSDPVYTASQGLLYSLERFPHGGGVKRAADLNGYQLCGIAGYNYRWLAELGVIGKPDTSTHDIQQAVLKVHSGGCDFLITLIEQLSGLNRMGEVHVPASLTVKRFPDFATQRFYFWVSRNSPRAEELLRILNEGLTKLKANGRYGAIFSRYIGDWGRSNLEASESH